MRPIALRLALGAIPVFAGSLIAHADRIDTFLTLGKAGTVTVAGANDVATASFLIQSGNGKKLVVSVKPAKKSTLALDVRLISPTGTLFDAATVQNAGGKLTITSKSVTYSLPNIPVGQAGMWRVEVRGANSTSGGATVTAKAKDVTSLSETLTVQTGSTVTKDIDVGSNQSLTLTLSRGAKGVTIRPRVKILDPNGNALDDGDFLGIANDGKGTVSLKAYRLPVFGRYKLVLSGDAGGGGAVKVVAKTAIAKAGKKVPVAIYRDVDPKDGEPSSPKTLNGTDSTGASGGSLEFVWSQVAGPAVQFTNPATSTPTFTAPATPTSLGFEFAVRENGVWSLPTQVGVEVGRRPLADAGRSQSVATAAAVTLDGSGSVDRSARGLRHVWRQDPSDAVQVTLAGAGTAAPTFAAPATPTVLHFGLVVDDGSVASFEDFVTVRVGGAGVATPDAGREQFVPRMATVHLSAFATITPSGALDVPLQWTKVSGPPEVVLADATTAYPSFQAPKQASELVFELTAGGTTDRVRVHVRGAETNLPPLSKGNGTQLAASGNVTLSGTQSIGPEAADTLRHRWAQVDGAPLPPADPSAATTTVNLPAGNETRVYAVQVNDGIAYGPPDFVAVRNTGYAGLPVAFAGNDITVQPGLPVQLDGRGSVRTAGTGPLTYLWRQVSAKDWFDVDAQIPAFDPTAATVTFTMPPSISSLTTRRTMTFELIVNDGVADSAPDLITVTYLNLPENGKPVATAGATLTNPLPGQVVQLQGNATDNENDPVTYRWAQTQGAAVALTGGVTARNPSFTAPATGTYAFQLFANDGFGEGLPSAPVVIVVDAAPTARAVVQPGSGLQGENVAVDGSGSTDPEGRPLTYTWTQTSGPALAALPTNTTTQSWNFQAPASSVTIRLVVNDGRQNSLPSTTTFTVGSPVAAAPTANRTSAGYGATVNLSGNITGTPTTISWTQLTTGQFANDPVVATINGSSSANASFTVPKPTGSTGFGGIASALPGATFQIVVTSGANSDTKTVRVTFFASFNDANGQGLQTGDQVYGIIQQNCMGSTCHSSTSTGGGCSSFQGFGMGNAGVMRTNTVGVSACSSGDQRVNSGNSASSNLIKRIKGTVSSQMGSLSAAQISLIADWIDQGAQNN